MRFVQRIDPRCVAGADRIARLTVVLSLLAALPAACAAPAPAAPAARLALRERGTYQIDRSDLKAAGLGWERVDPRTLHLYADGLERPLRADPKGDGWPLRFAAEGASPATEAAVGEGRAEEGRQVFLLVPGPAPQWIKQWLKPRPPARDWPGQPTAPAALPWPTPPAASAGVVMGAQTLQQRSIHQPLRPSGERWLGPRLTAPGSAELRFDLPPLLPGAGQLGLWLLAETEAPAAPDHRLTLSLNGDVVGDWSWDGAGERILWLTLPAQADRGDLPRGLRPGANTLTLSLPGLPEVLAEIVLLDHVLLRYPEAAPSAADLAGGPAKALPPQALERAGEGPDLRRPEAGADWLAVAAPELMADLAPLARRREAEGLKTMVVASNAVYEQFGAGAADGAALEAFLNHSAAHWRPAPRYVLLVGDATEDPAGYGGPPEGAMVATGRLFGTFGGWVPSDSVLTRGKGDVPGGVAIGRIPARRPEELHAVLDKIQRWEEAAASGAAWRRRALVVADPSEAGFGQDAARFAADLGQGVFASMPLEGDAGAGAAVAQTGAALRRALDEGLGLTVYLGHGSRRQWGRDSLLDRETAGALSNVERPGLVVNLSCLTGAFTHPTEPSLAETLLLSAKGGAAAVIAPSSLTLAAEQAPLASALAQALGDPATLRLGDALAAAWRAVPPETPGSREVALTFLLFGDPALKLGR